MQLEVKKLYHFIGTNTKTELRESIKVIGISHADAMNQITWAKDCYQEREPTELGKGWNGSKI